jgi:hypothetical protein
MVRRTLAHPSVGLWQRLPPPTPGSIRLGVGYAGYAQLAPHLREDQMADRMQNRSEGRTEDRSEGRAERSAGSRVQAFLRANPYRTLALAITVNFFIMFALTYAGVYRLEDVFVNLNRFYMALLMVAPMVVVMLLFMSHMYENTRLNLIVIAVAGVVFAGTFVGIQRQVFVGDNQFLRSMIPHHSIAIKTCEYAKIDDPEIIELCEQIIESQEEEIAQMREILARRG